jgi:L-fuconolactonase
MRIDAHQHYWDLTRNDYDWLTPELGVLYRNYLPEVLLPLLQANNISKTIVVQAAPTVAETEFLLQLSADNESIIGVVGWLDMTSAHFEQQLLQFMQKDKFIGIRPMLQDLDADDVLQPAMLKSFSILEKYDFPIDLLVRPKHLPAILKVMKQVPKLRAVIDHLAKPDIKNGVREPWESQISALAEYPNVYCKCSGMVTEADWQRWKREDFRLYIDHCIENFGAERLLFGSDWPVCLLAAQYEEVYQLILDLLPDYYGDEERDLLFGLNALRFYKINTERMS